jgi:cysteine desulfurase
MTANNETGALYDVAGAARAVRAAAPKAIVHTDAVQAFLKCDVSPKKSAVDMISVSAHKINAPKGTGALWVRESLIRAKDLSPYVVGGGQEDGMRSGTENTAGIAAFAAAVAEWTTEKERREEMTRELWNYAIDSVSRLIPEAKVNLPERSVCGIVSITLPDIRSETALNYLNGRGIFVSAGSACSAHSGKASAVLRAFGLTEREADSTIRVSIGHENTKEQIDAFCAALAGGVSTLQRAKR